MRSEFEIKNLILDFAKKDNRIRAVLLNGSRANSNIEPDKFQDFDLVFIVDRLDSFITDHSWTDIFGKKIIFQLPDEMTLGNENNSQKNISFTYLMLFEDKNRLDLTLFSKQKITSDFKPDSLTNLWLDKDNLFAKLPPSTDKDYHIQKPTEKEFLETCNEFWWVSTYVVKGLLRSEIIYAKGMLETVVRPMFMKVIDWKVGIENEFGVSMGKSSKYLKKYVSNDFYEKVLLTYSNFELEENWRSLLLMAEVFQQTSNFVADKLEFRINKIEEQSTMSYLKDQRDQKNCR
jgi:aminoglycoside 6-adenylyltransferase